MKVDDVISVTLFVFAGLPFVLALVAYARTPWRTTQTGRSVFQLLATIVAVLALGVIIRVIGIYTPAATLLRIVTLSAVMAAGWTFYLNLRRLQRDPMEKP